MIGTIKSCLNHAKQRRLDLKIKINAEDVTEIAIMTDSYTQSKETAKKFKKFEKTLVAITYEEGKEEFKNADSTLKNNICNSLISELSLKNEFEFFRNCLMFKLVRQTGKLAFKLTGHCRVVAQSMHILGLGTRRKLQQLERPEAKKHRDSVSK